MCVGTGYVADEDGRQTQGISSSNRNSSDDQKEKCKVAAKVRRSKETEYFKELENLLPVPKQVHESEESHFDKISLIRFSIAYLKTREVINTGYFTSSLQSASLPTLDILSCLDGFTLVLSSDGDVIYASDNITRYLGISKVDILCQPFFHYVHPCDHQQLKMLTCHKGNKEAENHVEILVRIKCLVTERGRMVNLKQASYKSVKISGKTQHIKGSKQGGVFMGMARVVGLDGGDRQQIGVFSTKHGIDMRFSEADTWLSTIAGYSPHHLVGTSFYALVHPQDSKMVQRAFKNLSAHGVCETAPYRLLCSGGGQVWVQTVARVVCRRGKQGQAVVCRHYQISGVFARGEVLSSDQLENQRKTNEVKRNLGLVMKKDHMNIVGRWINNTTFNIPAANSRETTVQNLTKSPILVIIDRRRNSEQKINDEDKKFREGQPNCVTSRLFEYSETLHSKPELGMDFVPQPHYQIILEKNEKMTIDAPSSKETDDDADFLKNFQFLEESIQMEELEQLSPHSGYESVTFGKSDDLQFLDFVNPIEFEPDYQAAGWANMTLPDPRKRKEDRMYEGLREDEDKQCDNSMVYKENNKKASNDKDMDDSKIEIGKQAYPNEFLGDKTRCDMWQNPWTHSCGTSNNQRIPDYLQHLRTKQDQSFPSGWPGASRKSDPGMASHSGQNFKKMRFDSNML